MGSRHDEVLRSMYRGGVGDWRARGYARLWAAVFATAPIGRRWVTLEVTGRSSGLPRRFPLGMADQDGAWYLGSMLGECHWVRNVRATGGHARILRAGWSLPVVLREVPVEQRPALIKRYLQQVPGARPHLAVPHHADVSAFEAIAADTPIFAVETLTGLRAA